jgi:hypothetical protein
MGLRPTQGDEKRLLSEATLPWKHRPHLCHLDLSEAQWKDFCVDAPSWKCFSTERIEGHPSYSLCASYDTNFGAD